LRRIGRTRNQKIEAAIARPSSTRAAMIDGTLNRAHWRPEAAAKNTARAMKRRVTAPRTASFMRQRPRT
jgi:hypothetical protein